MSDIIPGCRERTNFMSICLAKSSKTVYFDGKVILMKHVSATGNSISLSNLTSMSLPVGSTFTAVQKQHRSVRLAPSKKQRKVS